MELIGRQFGHIRVTGVVGEGGMGAVYAGHDEKLDRKVALKVLHADQRLDTEARERLLREARALSKVDHPNICRIHDYIETGDVDLLVLEYIDGRTLQRALGEGLPYGEKLRIALAVAEVLVRAHRAGIVHRDLKPENVMLTSTGEVKVLDFGLARWLQKGRSSVHAIAGEGPTLRVGRDPDDGGALGSTVVLPSARRSEVSPSGRREFLATAAGVTLGTPLYMSPEQARGENLTPASDMFSFGLLLQVLFTGHEPHGDDMSAREVILRVARGETNPVVGAPKAITALINSLKQPAPTDRPTAVETVERLKFLITSPQRMVRRAIAAGVAAVLLLGGWRYVVDLDRERSIAVAARAEAETQRAKAEDMIEFMLGDLRRKLEPVGRLDVLDAAAQRALKYVNELNPERSSAAELARSSKALNQLVEVRIAQGKLDDALDLATRSLRLTSVAVLKSPEDPEVQLAHGLSHFWVGNVRRLQGDYPTALERMKSYSAVTTKLARQYPANETYQIERAYGHGGVATILELLGKRAEALPQYEMTRDVKAALAAAQPQAAARQADLAVTLNKVGVVLLRLGDLRRSAQHFQREASIYEGLVAADPGNRVWQDRLGRSYGYLAAARESMGDHAAAEALVDKELTLLAALHDLDPANLQWTRNLAMANLHRGWLFLAAGDADAAAQSVDSAESLMEQVAAKDPKVKTWSRDRTLILLGRVRVLLARRQAPAAQEVIDRTRVLVEAGKDAQSSAELTLFEGDVAQALGRSDRARERWQTAAESLAGLPSFAKDPQLQDLYVRAMYRLQRHDQAAALVARLDEIGYARREFIANRRLYGSSGMPAHNGR